MRQVFINLAVMNLEPSLALYQAMGFSINPQFSDDTAKCMVWSEHIFVMLMTHEKMQTFTQKNLADTRGAVAALYALSVGSVDEMNTVADKAIAAGAIEPKPLQNYGFMQLRTLEDFDGHTWEIFYMDMAQAPQE